jgi:hypothetical protein
MPKEEIPDLQKAGYTNIQTEPTTQGRAPRPQHKERSHFPVYRNIFTSSLFKQEKETAFSDSLFFSQ